MNYNNNNKTFKSQTSRGRLELKPIRSNQGSGTWIAVFQALLSKAKSLGIFHPFKSPFIASTQVNFGLPLPLFTLLSWLRIPLRTGASGGLRWTCPNHLNRYWTSFSSIGATLIYHVYHRTLMTRLYLISFISHYPWEVLDPWLYHYYWCPIWLCIYFHSLSFPFGDSCWVLTLAYPNLFGT